MNLILLGLPGSGKGTAAKELEGTGIGPHLSIGDVLRQEAEAGTELGKQVKPYLDQGKMVPASITLPLVEQRILSADCQSGFLLDGFPRTLEQAQAFGEILRKAGKRIDHVIWIDTAQEVIVERLSGRRICTQCRAVYHIRMNPPLKDGFCDHCGHPLSRRTDDRPEVAALRIRQSLQDLAPVRSYYERLALLQTVDGNRPYLEVVRDIRRLLRNVRLAWSMRV